MKNLVAAKNIAKEKNNKNIFLNLTKGTIFAYFITLLVFIIYGILITYTDITEKNMQLIVMITTVVSVLVSGFISAKGISSKGLLLGSLAGIIYFIILLMVAFCVLPNIQINSKLLMLFVLSICSGGVGGIIGINLKS